jgi:hypothetical protein
MGGPNAKRRVSAFSGLPTIQQWPTTKEFVTGHPDARMGAFGYIVMKH